MEPSDDAPIRVLIADDDEDIRVLLGLVIEDAAGMELVGAADSAEDATRLAQELDPDVALVDWMMPGGGETAVRQIIGRRPNVRVIAFTAGDPVHASQDMIGAGAAAFLAKSSSNEEIIAGIRSVLRS